MRSEVATIILPRDRYENLRCGGVVKESRQVIFSVVATNPGLYVGIEGEEEAEDVKEEAGSSARLGAGLQK